MVADHGDIKRGLEIEHYAQEAVIHWNAPPLAKSRGFCEAALKHQFPDHKKDWTSAFSHSSHRDHKGKAGGKRKAFFVSKTMEREVNKQPKFSFMTMESSNASSRSSSSSSTITPPSLSTPKESSGLFSLYNEP
jgi:hypothetical protein